MYEWCLTSRCLLRLLMLSLCGVVCERLLPCRVVVGWMDCIMYTDYVFWFCPIAHWHFLPPLSFQKVFLFFLSFPLLFHHASLFFISGLLALLYLLVILPDEGSHFAFLFSSAFSQWKENNDLLVCSSVHPMAAHLLGIFVVDWLMVKTCLIRHSAHLWHQRPMSRISHVFWD